MTFLMTLTQAQRAGSAWEFMTPPHPLGLLVNDWKEYESPVSLPAVETNSEII